MDFFRDKKVFITGGSSGIGLATAKLLASFGASVAIAARGRDRLEGALRDVQAAAGGGGASPRFHAVALDISDRIAVRKAAAEVLSAIGGLDILINNAGITHPGYLHELPDEIFDRMMAVNYHGTVNVTRAFLPHFMTQQHGTIANVSSVLGYMGVFGYGPYSASKFAVTGFSDCLWQDLLPYGIKVSLLFPPDTDTPQFHEENKIKPGETKALSGNVKVLPPEFVASAFAKGIAAGKFHIVPGLDNKFVYYTTRFAPWIARPVMARMIMGYRRKHSGAWEVVKGR